MTDECLWCGDGAGNSLRYVKVIDDVIEVETWTSKKRHRLPDGTDDKALGDREYAPVSLHHYEPCQACCPERKALYDEGHWDDDHNPCPKCLRYRDPARWQKAQKAG